MDALSEALRSLRVTGAVFLNGEFSAPWGVAAPPLKSVPAGLAPGIEHLALFHLITEGAATVRVAGSDEVHLEAGDIVVLPRGDSHELWNGRVGAFADGSSALPKLFDRSVSQERMGGGGPVTKLICGYFGCERYAERLFLAGLPPAFKVSIRRDASGAWIETTMRQLAADTERDRAGRVALLAKLAEALFIETLCRYMAELPPERTGWLAAARDELVGKALAQLHRDPGRSWTLATLARESGASRTVLAERFSHFVGLSPLAYLAQWRLQLAARLLETTDRNVLQVAMEVGYESEAAFSRAFKRAFDRPPAKYGREQRENQNLK